MALGKARDKSGLVQELQSQPQLFTGAIKAAAVEQVRRWTSPDWFLGRLPRALLSRHFHGEDGDSQDHALWL